MIDGVVIKSLDIIPADKGKGEILHAFHSLRDPEIDLKEVYFSSISKSSFRAWKLHTKMTVNLLAIHGSVNLVLIDKRKNSSTLDEINEFILSQNPYFRIKIPPGIWFGFQGVGRENNIICNFADFHHDKNEVRNCEYGELKYKFKEIVV